MFKTPFGNFIDYSASNTVPFIQEDLLKQKDIYERLDDPRVIVDIGAHVGVVSCYLSKLYPQAMIYSIEPFTPSYNNLVENIRTNECSNIVPFNIGMSRSNGTMNLNTSPVNTGVANIVFGYSTGSVEVETQTLLKFLDQTVKSGIDFLKVDTEGGEYSIFKDFKAWHLIKDMFVELHTLYPYPNECWNGLMNEMKKKLLSAPIWGKATVHTPDGFKDE